MARVLHGMPIETLPDSGELNNEDEIVAYRQDTGKAYRTAIGKLPASAETNISDAFSSDIAYSAGDYCIYNNTLYRFISDYTGDWDQSVVVQTNVGIELATTTTSLGDMEETLEADMSSLQTSVSQVQSGLTNGSVTKVGTSTVGGAARGIYLSSGTPTACSSTVGGAARPVYMSSGTITACASTTSNSWYIRNGWCWRAFNGVTYSSISAPSSSYYPVVFGWYQVIVNYSSKYYMGAISIGTGGAISGVYYASYGGGATSMPSSATISGTIIYRYS